MTPSEPKTEPKTSPKVPEKVPARKVAPKSPPKAAKEEEALLQSGDSVDPERPKAAPAKVEPKKEPKPVLGRLYNSSSERQFVQYGTDSLVVLPRSWTSSLKLSELGELPTGLHLSV